LGQFERSPRPEIAADAPKALFFSPHPDDECISGGIALRLLREARMNVINVAVTLGAKKERQAERYRELENACRYIGFALLSTAPGGLERVTPESRHQDYAHWTKCVKTIADILAANQPRVILCPHDRDWHQTHLGTHLLVLDALKQMPPSFESYLVETEFWGAMSSPNLMVEISTNDLGDMMTAASFHIGEVKRNPYHVLLPAWMLDNVRRGAELVGGQGAIGPDFNFAALYRLRKWEQGELKNVFEGGKLVPSSKNIGQLFA
jgi:LmbE family N-acetylglucosaminyl deacetylase